MSFICIKFKYISCYSLTANLGRMGNNVDKFKYISCYSLTFNIDDTKDADTEFKYISCYSLTKVTYQGKKIPE